MRFTIAIGVLTTMIPESSSSAHKNNLLIEQTLAASRSHHRLPRNNRNGARGLPLQSHDRKQRLQRSLQQKASTGSSLLRSSAATQSNTIKECDPKSNDQGAADVGILSCASMEACIEQESSSLGGICESILATTRSMQEDTTVVEENPPYGVICDPTAAESQGTDCDCTAWDATTETGRISCVRDDSPICLVPECNTTCLNIREFYEVDGGGILLSGYDYDIYSPYRESAVYTYFTDKTCEFQVNGTVCSRCELIPLAGDVNFTNSCVSFDCTNAGGTQGNSCDFERTPGIDYQYISPLIAYCERNAYPVCDFCPGGELTLLDEAASADATTLETCESVYNLGSRGLITEDECQATASFIKIQCGCEGEDGGAVVPATPVPVPATPVPVPATAVPVPATSVPAPGDGVGVVVPANPGPAPEDPTALPALDPTVAPADPTDAPADPTAAPVDPTATPVDDGNGDGNEDGTDSNGGVACNICGAGSSLSNPDATVSVPGQDAVSCAALQATGDAGTISTTQCSLLPQFVSAICGCSGSGGGSGALGGQSHVLLASTMITCISTFLYTLIVQ